MRRKTTTSLVPIDFSNPTCKQTMLFSTRESMPTSPIVLPCHSFYRPPKQTGGTTRSTQLSLNSSHRPSAKPSQCPIDGRHQVTQYPRLKTTTLRARWNSSHSTPISSLSTTDSKSTDTTSETIPSRACLLPNQEATLPCHQPCSLPLQDLIPILPGPVVPPFLETLSHRT